MCVCPPFVEGFAVWVCVDGDAEPNAVVAVARFISTECACPPWLSVAPRVTVCVWSSVETLGAVWVCPELDLDVAPLLSVAVEPVAATLDVCVWLWPVLDVSVVDP